LSQNEGIDGLLFTGSAQVGAILHKQFGGKPQKVLALEMGGNNPLIVDRVKDIMAASYLTIQSAFITSGQRCVCARRLIVLDNDWSKEFLVHFVEMTKRIKVGPFDEQPEVFMGPMVTEAAALNVMRWQKKLEGKGARILLRSEPIPIGKSMITPGIIDTTGIEVDDVEIFGPLLQVIVVKDLESAINEANKTQYGLSAGILTEDDMHYRKFYERSFAGIVNRNRQITGASSQAPFGGVGLSGNHQPSAFFAADYCAYPVASIETNKCEMPQSVSPGIAI